MPINFELYHTPAIRGDISGIAISASIALDAIAETFETIMLGGKPTPEQIAKIREQSKRLDEIFDTLTGYHSE